VGLLNLEDVQPGMVLAGDVTDDRGRLLLRRGNALTEKHLRIFKTWGVTQIDIEGVEREEIEALALAQLDPVRLEEAQTVAKELFRHAEPTHPAVAELLRLCTLRLASARTGADTHGH